MSAWHPVVARLGGRRGQGERRSGPAWPRAARAVIARLMRRFGDRWWMPGGSRGGAVRRGADLRSARSCWTRSSTDSRRSTTATPATTCSSWRRPRAWAFGEVYTVDASRRTTAANAYVTGLGATRRVVLFDTLLEDFTPGGDASGRGSRAGPRPPPRRLAGPPSVALVAPAAMRAVARLTRRTGPAGREPGRPAGAGPVVAVVAAPVGVVSNRLSRALERRADAFALELTDAPDAFTSFEQRIVVANLGDPDPPGWFNVLLATHPPAVERIGIARAHAARCPERLGRRRRPWRPPIRYSAELDPPYSGRFLMPSRAFQRE